MKLGGILFMLVSLAGILTTPNCDHQNANAPKNQGNRATPAPTPMPKEMETPVPTDGEIKELVAGAYCTVLESFVIVARDPETYAALRAMNQNIKLPDEAADFFKSNAVIAAFLGQRRTGGFAVDISRGTSGEINILERSPKKGAMVIQVLTTPFKIVSVPANMDAPITLSLDATWKARLRNYQVTSGELNVTGGFAGIHESSGLAGTLQVMRADMWATFIFDLQSTNKAKTRQLRDVATGTATQDGVLKITRIDSHGLSGAIQSPFKATGQFTNDEAQLSLDLDTVSAAGISDNFQAKASLKATATTPRPPNRAITGDN